MEKLFELIDEMYNEQQWERNLKILKSIEKDVKEYLSKEDEKC